MQTFTLFMLLFLAGGSVLALVLMLREQGKPLDTYKGRASGLSAKETYVVVVHRFVQYAMLFVGMYEGEWSSEGWQGEWPLAFSLFVVLLGLTYLCVGLAGRPRILNLSITATLAGGGPRAEREGRGEGRFLNVFLGTMLVFIAIGYSILG